MAKPELGTKRICPDTGRKFYDLNKDPIVSPYSGKSFPLSFFEDTESSKVIEKEDEEEVTEVDGENANVEMVSLEEADEEKSGGGDGDLPDIDEDSDVELDDDDSDTFLEADDDEDDDMSGIIGGRPEDEEES